MSNRVADIYVQGIKAGQLTELDKAYEFRYLPEYLNSDHPIPVSLTLPLREEPYISRVLIPFFDGLIPEGWLLNAVREHWGIPEKNRFGILLVACRDCIGDVQVVKEGEEL